MSSLGSFFVDGLRPTRRFKAVCRLQPLPRFHVIQFHRLGRIAHHLRNHVLAFHIVAVAQRQNNRADHRNQQDQTRQLEQQEIFVVQDQAQGCGVVTSAGVTCVRSPSAAALVSQAPKAMTNCIRITSRSARPAAYTSPSRPSVRQNRRPASSRQTGTAPQPRRHRQ